MRKFRARVTLIGAVLAAAVTLAGCGSSGTGTTTATSIGSTSPVTTEAKVVPVALRLTQGSYSVSTSEATISGITSTGASISVNGTEATVHSGHWHDRLHLHIGSNQVEVEATMSGRSPATRVVHVIRHHSAAELEALARARASRAKPSVNTKPKRANAKNARPSKSGNTNRLSSRPHAPTAPTKTRLATSSANRTKARPSPRELPHGAKTAPTASANRVAGHAPTTVAWRSGSTNSRCRVCSTGLDALVI